MRKPLRQNFLDNSSRFDARQFRIQAIEWVREPFMIDSELVEDGRMQVANVNSIANNVVTVVVGFAVGDSWLDSASRLRNRLKQRG